MKKIIGIIFVSLMFCNIGFAESTKAKILERYKIKLNPIATEVVVIACIDGYKFITGGGKSFSSMLQFYEERDGKSLPAKC